MYVRRERDEAMAFKISNFILLDGAALTTKQMRSQKIIEKVSKGICGLVLGRVFLLFSHFISQILGKMH